MKRTVRFIPFAVAAIALACSVSAQDANAPAKAPDPAPAAKADNTERNVSDRSGETLTPLDQGNNKADLATTAQIRKDILATKNMSVNAQNVKIITNGGKVTLRGPVNSAEEKRLIGDLAEKVARPGNVDNQLEVKVIAAKVSPLGQPTAPPKP